MKRSHRPASRVCEEITTDLFTCASCKWRSRDGGCRKMHGERQQMLALLCRDYGFRES